MLNTDTNAKYCITYTLEITQNDFQNTQKMSGKAEV